MANQSVISGGNLFSRRAYPNHTLAGDEEPSGHEAFRIATGRRSPYTNYWEGITANQQRTLTLTCDRVRSANLFVLDRGHNLDGKEVILECANVSDFSSAQVVFDIVLPSAVGAGSLDDDFGVKSEEGAWYKRFPTRDAYYWRIRIPAMGANLKPKVVGAHLSLAFAFDPWRPNAPDQDELGGDVSESDTGAQGIANPWNRRTDTLRVQLLSAFDYEIAYNAFKHFFKRRATFYIPNDSWAQTACCILRPPGVSGFGKDPDYFPHKAMIPYIEHEAANG